MLEGVHRGGEGVGLVEKLGGLKASEVPVQDLLRHFGHGLQQRQGDVFANDRRGLEQALGGSR